MESHITYVSLASQTVRLGVKDAQSHPRYQLFVRTHQLEQQEDK